MHTPFIPLLLDLRLHTPFSKHTLRGGLLFLPPHYHRPTIAQHTTDTEPSPATHRRHTTHIDKHFMHASHSHTRTLPQTRHAQRTPVHTLSYAHMPKKPHRHAQKTRPVRIHAIKQSPL